MTLTDPVAQTGVAPKCCNTHPFFRRFPTSWPTSQAHTGISKRQKETPREGVRGVNQIYVAKATWSRKCVHSYNTSGKRSSCGARAQQMRKWNASTRNFWTWSQLSCLRSPSTVLSVCFESCTTCVHANTSTLLWQFVCATNTFIIRAYSFHFRIDCACDGVTVRVHYLSDPISET